MWLWLVGLTLLSACSPVYVLRVGYEEAKILWYRRPISDVLQRPSLDPATRDKLQLVLRVRDFAEHELGFHVGGSYASLTEVSRPPVVHVLTAAPRTRLEPYTWWFPIVGRVAYKGYFNEGLAQADARRLEAQGYDTAIRKAAAFSTLGWFDDPLLPHLLGYDAETLANVIFHELFHSTFYLAGHTAFNESLANFAGHRAAIVFFAKERGQHAALARQAEARWRRELRLSEFLTRAAERLVALYASSLPESDKLSRREELFAQFQAEHRALVGPAHAKAGLASDKLNNAILLNQLVYLRELGLFERVYQQIGRAEKDLPGALTAMTEAAERAAEPFSGIRALLELAVCPPAFLHPVPSHQDATAVGRLRSHTLFPRHRLSRAWSGTDSSRFLLP